MLLIGVLPFCAIVRRCWCAVSDVSILLVGVQNEENSLEEAKLPSLYLFLNVIFLFYKQFLLAKEA